jgi:hypothetical protein
MVLSLARDFVLLAPMCIILPKYFGVVGPLYSAPIADVICLIITIIVMAHTFQGMSKKHSAARNVDLRNAQVELD